MLRIGIDEVLPGMELARAVRTSDRRILLRDGVKLRDSLISRLKDMGYLALYIKDGLTDDVAPDMLLSDETQAQAVQAVQRVFDDVSQRKLVNSQAIRQVVHHVLDEILGQRQVLIGIMDIRASDDYTFSHSVDVCTMALMVGQAMGYTQAKLHELGVGALLHDIGKTKVPLSIVTKPQELTWTEYAELQRHCEYGFEILRKHRDISLLSAHVAYQHHERNEGQGYPRGLRGSEIHPYAQIVAVVDTFDAMTADRVYRQGRSPVEAVHEIESLKGSFFNPLVVERLVERVALYPVCAVVRLNTGELAVVMEQNRSHQGRPIVLIAVDENGVRRDRPIRVDLTADRDRSILELAPSAKDVLLNLPAKAGGF